MSREDSKKTAAPSKSVRLEVNGNIKAFKG